MSDVEWYVESEGKRTGPFSAENIVQMHKEGKISSDAMATAARMQGDWVSVSDLVEAFRELNQKKSPPPRSSGDGHSSFQAPPRPTEQLEASKIINLNLLREEGKTDATDSLFQAIQAIREKSSAKATQAALPKDNWGELRRPTQNVPQRTTLIATLVVVLMIAAYGVMKLLKDEPGKTVENKKTETEAPPLTKPVRPITRSETNGGNLLGGNGASPARTTPPVRFQPSGGATRLDDRNDSERKRLQNENESRERAIEKERTDADERLHRAPAPGEPDSAYRDEYGAPSDEGGHYNDPNDGPTGSPEGVAPDDS